MDIMKNKNPFAKTDAEQLYAVMKDMRKTRWGRKICDWLDKNNIQIVLTTKIDEKTGGFVSYPYEKITLNAGSSVTDMMLSIVHEARHLWQARALAGFGGNDRLCLYGHFAANPYALYIFNRLVEADAFSYQHTFMIDFFTQVPGHRRVNLTSINRKTFARLDCDQKNINVPEAKDLMRHRRAAFDAFFDSTEIMQGYDKARRKAFVKDCVDAVMLGNRGYFQHMSGEKTPAVLHEEIVACLGNSMCGELEGWNYLSDPLGRVELKPSYTADFNKADRVRLKRAAYLPGARKLNTYVRRNGQKQKLIS